MDTKENFKEKLLSLQNGQFTGRLDVTTDQGKEWRLYFCLSRLVWADGSYHTYRVWQRLLSQYCPELDQNKINLQEAKQFECWNYHVIIILLERGLISKAQAIQLIQARIFEAIFDIFQAEAIETLECEIIPVSASVLWELGLKVSIILLTIKNAVNQVELQWLEWDKQGLTYVSPNLAPVIKNTEFFQTRFSEKTYQKLSLLFNGRYPLRELANKLNQDIFNVTLWLKPFIEKGLIDLIAVPDNPVKITLIGINKTTLQISKTTPQKVIACIDDSLQICQIMEHIVTKNGYEFIGIQEPLKVLPNLIKSKPDLIFLDLIMPIVNGYEICAQIRRVSQLKDIPVIILTGNDGMIDRIRSKIVGASGFLGKPVNEQKVITVINNFFSVKTSKLKPPQLLNNLNFNTQIVS